MNLKALIYTKTRQKILIGEFKAILERLKTDVKRNSADIHNGIGKLLVQLYNEMLKISVILHGPQHHPRKTSSFIANDMGNE